MPACFTCAPDHGHSKQGVAALHGRAHHFEVNYTQYWLIQHHFTENNMKLHQFYKNGVSEPRPKYSLFHERREKSRNFTIFTIFAMAKGVTHILLVILQHIIAPWLSVGLLKRCFSTHFGENYPNICYSHPCFD